MRRTKIVATIGPASRDPEVLVRMIEAGMDVARLNFSHGTADEHAETAQLVREAAGRTGRQVAILQTSRVPSCASARWPTGSPSSSPATT
jgi:pyruvate kinase